MSNIAIGGTNASSFRLAAGQPTTLTIAPGASATVSVLFTPTVTTVCATNASQISSVERFATLTFNSTAVEHGDRQHRSGGSERLRQRGFQRTGPRPGHRCARLHRRDSNGTGGARRALGPLRPLPNSDQVQVPYFVRADASKPVTLTPVAHFSGRSTSTFGRTGWYQKGAAITTPCSATCNQLFTFPADSAAPGPYNQNQKLMPTVTGQHYLHSHRCLRHLQRRRRRSELHRRRAHHPAHHRRGRHHPAALQQGFSGVPGLRSRARADPEHLDRGHRHLPHSGVQDQ